MQQDADINCRRCLLSNCFYNAILHLEVELQNRSKSQMANKILQEGQSYTFRSYFEMPYEADGILAEFGYRLRRSRLTLPIISTILERLPELKQRLEETLVLINLSNESARWEALVFPVLLEVARFCQCQIRIEYPLMVNNWLKGNSDYLLRRDGNLLVIEAKNADLAWGFKYLCKINCTKFRHQTLIQTGKSCVNNSARLLTQLAVELCQ